VIYDCEGVINVIWVWVMMGMSVVIVWVVWMWLGNDVVVCWLVLLVGFSWVGCRLVCIGDCVGLLVCV